MLSNLPPGCTDRDIERNANGEPTPGEFKIGETIENTVSFGTVKVMDIFVSVTNPRFFCYRVEDEKGESFLCNEEDLITEETHGL